MRSKFGAIRTAKEKRIKEDREAKEQIAYFEYFERFYPEIWEHLFHIPNGGSRHVLEAINLKKQGVKKGVLDIHMSVASRGFHSLYIEMKDPLKKGRISKEQKEWINRLKNTGNCVFVANNWVEAANQTFYYLNRPERVE